MAKPDCCSNASYHVQFTEDQTSGARLMRNTTAVLAMALLLSATSAQAALLAHYRMGDDDGGAGSNVPSNGGAIAIDPNGTLNQLSGGSAWGILRGRPSTGGGPAYSNNVPGPQIYDPISNSVLNNNWSFKTTNTNTSQGSKGNTGWDTNFALEMFIYFDVADMSAVRGMEFVNHRSSGSGGWRFYVENTAGATQDTIRAEINTVSPTNQTLVLNGTTKLVPQTWHHLGFLYKLNGDTSHTSELYLNYALDGTGTVPAGQAFGTTAFQVFLGHVSGGGSTTRTITIDEFRYFNDLISPQSFLVIPEPSAMVLTGVCLLGFGAIFGRSRR
jgi:hypothetical protein